MVAQSSRIEFANTLRGLAAMSVVISHLMYFFWAGRDTISFITGMPVLTEEMMNTPQFAIIQNNGYGFSFGPFGVAVFFLISGFVIPFSLKRLSPQRFIVNRIFRIYPTYIAGFAVTLLAVYVGNAYFSTVWPYTQSEVLIHFIPGLRDLLWSRNIDGVIWTLEVELKFYIICALAIPLFRRNSIAILVIPVVITAISAIFFQFTTSLMEYPAVHRQALNFMYAAPYLAFMFIGSIFHLHYMRSISLITGLLAIAFSLGLMWCGWKYSAFSDQSGVMIGYLYGLALFSFAYFAKSLFKSNAVVNFFADISYPMYVVHSVMGYVVIRILSDHGVVPELSVLAAIFTAVAVSYAIHRVVELPSMRLEKLIFSSRGPVEPRTIEPEPS